MHPRPLAPADQSLESLRTQVVSETVASIRQYMDVKFAIDRSKPSIDRDESHDESHIQML